MKLLRLTYGLLLLMALISCQKEEAVVPPIDPDSIKILPLEGVNKLFFTVAGEGTIIYFYRDAQSYYRMAISDNEGKLIVDREIEIDPNATINTVFLDNQGEFNIITGQRLFRVDNNGEITYDNPEFFVNAITVSKVHVLDDENYLVMGSIYLGGNRAGYAKYSRDGEQIYTKYYAVNVNGTQSFTGAVPLGDGRYFLAGGFVSRTSSIDDHMIVTVIGEDGVAEWTKIHSLNEYEDIANYAPGLEFIGRDLERIISTRLLYIISSKGGQSSIKHSRLYTLDLDGEIIGEPEQLDLSELNIVPGGYQPHHSIVRNQDGTFTGLVNEVQAYSAPSLFNDPINYNTPRISYFFDLNSNGQLENMEFMDQNYSTEMNTVLRLSDGRTALVGSLLSLGIDIRIMLIIRS